MSRRVEQVVLVVGILLSMILAGWSFARQQEAAHRADRVSDALEDAQIEVTTIVGESQAQATEIFATQAFWSTTVAEAQISVTQALSGQSTAVAVQSTSSASESSIATAAAGGEATTVAALATADSALAQLAEAQGAASTLQAELISANAIATAVSQVGGQQAAAVADAQQQLIEQQATVAAGLQVAPVTPTPEPAAEVGQDAAAEPQNTAAEPNAAGAAQVTIGEATASLEVNADGCAGDAAEQFTATSTIYVVAAGSTVPAGAEVAVRFYLNNQPYDELPVDTTAAVENGCIGVSYGPSGSVAVLQRGDWRAEFRVGDEATDSTISFTVD